MKYFSFSKQEEDSEKTSNGGILLPAVATKHVEKLVNRQKLLDLVVRLCLDHHKHIREETLRIQMSMPVLRGHTVYYDLNCESRMSCYFNDPDFVRGEERCIGYISNAGVRNALDSHEGWEEVVDAIGDSVLWFLDRDKLKDRYDKRTQNEQS